MQTIQPNTIHPGIARNIERSMFGGPITDSTQHSITAPHTVHEHDKQSMLSISPHVRALRDNVSRQVLLGMSTVRPASVLAGEN